MHMSFRPHYWQHHQQSHIDTSHCFPGCLQHSMVSDLTRVSIIGLPSRLWSRTQAWLYFPVCLYVCGAVPYHGAIHRSASTFVEPHPSMVSFFRSASTFVEPYPRIVPSIGHIDCQSFDLRFEPLLPACKRVAVDNIPDKAHPAEENDDTHKSRRVNNAARDLVEALTTCLRVLLFE